MVFMAIATAFIGCTRSRVQSMAHNESDTLLVVEDSTEEDTLLYIEEEEDEGLTLENHTTEVFGDFIFAFIHNARFRSERIRFPLPVTTVGGDERSIDNYSQFREEFVLPGNDYYTLMLGKRGQMDVFQDDSTLVWVDLQVITLRTLQMTSYTFGRNDGRWFLTSRHEGPVPAELEDFYQFYNQFSSDTIFQQESLAPQLSYTMEDPDEEGNDIEGTIDSGQWPAFRPEMPHDEFVNISFGQAFPNPNRLLMVQCGISEGMLDVFTFHKDGHKWQLTSYEN